MLYALVLRMTSIFKGTLSVSPLLYLSECLMGPSTNGVEALYFKKCSVFKIFNTFQFQLHGDLTTGEGNSAELQMESPKGNGRILHGNNANPKWQSECPHCWVNKVVFRVTFDGCDVQNDA